MLETIFNLLDIAKETKQSGEYIKVALGKNKYPDSVREAYKIFKQELWQKR